MMKLTKLARVGVVLTSLSLLVPALVEARMMMPKYLFEAHVGRSMTVQPHSIQRYKAVVTTTQNNNLRKGQTVFIELAPGDNQKLTGICQFHAFQMSGTTIKNAYSSGCRHR
ncbi:MAG: hypothetical protein WAQ53_00950 [Thiofilum sp.]|uniref:hypothetical protein n=1 Tax=Thiofilum sp. TaxID=2212733 RepID=UPI0025D48FF4|nr:hypothetical protein [Thiofilum sp.]MBK8455551.1 hypothetical protein [Thiofilum sp.]